MEAVNTYHLVHAQTMALRMGMLQGTGWGSIITRNFLHNQQVERIWRDVKRMVVSQVGKASTVELSSVESYRALISL